MALCEPCQRKGKKASPVKWCTQCEEALCKTCHDSHISMKALMSHKIIEIDNSKPITSPVSMKPFSQQCRRHTDLGLEYYCLFHDAICCQACISQYHRSCTKIIPLDVASKGTKESRNTTELISQLDNINNILDDLRQKRLRNIEQLGDQDVAIRILVSKLRQRAIEHLNKIEKDLFNELASIKKAATAKLEREARKIKETENLVSSHKERLEFQMKDCTDKETFIAVNAIKNQITGIEEKILRIKLRSSIISLSFKENGDMSDSIASFGTVSLTSDSHHTSFQETTLNSSREEKEIFIQGFEFSHKFEPSSNQDVMITGMAATDDKRLLLCGGGRCNVIVCTYEGKHLQEIKMAGEPWDIAIVQDRSNKAVASLPYLYSVQFINTNSMVAGKLVKFSWRVYGISSIQKKVIVGGRNNLHILDSDGNKLNDIPVPSISVFYIHPRENGDLYYSDSSYIYCMKPDGRHVFCQSLSHLDSPRNIVTDNRGNLYVAGHRSHNVHRMSCDGISLDMPLSKEDGIKGPFVISFSPNERSLFVSNDNGKTILVYRTVYASTSKEAELQNLLSYL